jgi:hypothetical protein
MLTLLPLVIAAQTPPALIAEATVARPASQEIIQLHQDIRPLPGQLDSIPVFNSNSPEVVQREGILLSTFPPDSMSSPTAHLDYPLEGRFDIFAHHIARGLNHDDNRTLFLGIIVHNPNNYSVTLDLLQSVSYLSQEAPFYDLPSYVANPLGRTFSGPGSRTMNDVLRGERQDHWQPTVRIPAGQTYLLANLPIPLRRLTVATNGTLPPGYVLQPPLRSPDEDEENDTNSSAGVRRVNTSPPANPNQPLPTNGRSLLMHARTDGPVYMASLAMNAPLTPDGNERVPTLAEWQILLTQGGLAGPRDIAPTPPDRQNFSRFFYGRVAGIAQGSEWKAELSDIPGNNILTIPDRGQRISYTLSTVDHNTLGTGQIQSAPMLDRYDDTAYRAHGNYGVKYDLSMPLYNPTNDRQTVTLSIQTPLQDENAESFLRFRDPPDAQIFFRGTLRLTYIDDFGILQTRYLHVIHRRGQQGEPLISLDMLPGDRRLVQVELLYPPDATPPQVLTLHTVDNTQNQPEIQPRFRPLNPSSAEPSDWIESSSSFWDSNP